MKRIKLLSLAIALSLAGAIYAAGSFAQSTTPESGKNQQSAGCCASGADCCKEGAGCCAKRKANHKNHADESGDVKENCCASGASCCNDGASCCAKRKAGGEKTEEQACDMSQRGDAGCCKEGASCCAGGSCSTARKP